MIKAINKLCDGMPSKETVTLLKFLSRPVPVNPQTVFVFGTNLDVDMFNHDKLEKLPGEKRTYKSEDSDDRKILRNCGAPMALALKLNCKVLITQNLSNGLVNGLAGKVTNMTEDIIQVKIDEDENLCHCFWGQTFDIQRYSFLVCDEQGDVIGCRKQFSLKLGYATTVHKAQGRTIPHLNID